MIKLKPTAMAIAISKDEENLKMLKEPTALSNSVHWRRNEWCTQSYHFCQICCQIHFCHGKVDITGQNIKKKKFKIERL